MNIGISSCGKSLPGRTLLQSLKHDGLGEAQDSSGSSTDECF